MTWRVRRDGLTQADHPDPSPRKWEGKGASSRSPSWIGFVLRDDAQSCTQSGLKTLSKLEQPCN